MPSGGCSPECLRSAEDGEFFLIVGIRFLLGGAGANHCLLLISVMKNLLLGLSRKMRLSQKTVYQMSQAMNMPGSFWPTHQPKDFGCHLGKKSKSCSAHEDPMYDIIRENKRHEKDIRIQQLKQLLEDSTSDDDGSSSSSSEDKEKHKKKKKKEKHKKKKKEKKKKKKRKHKSSKSNESSDSE
ncbi:retinitis pigmentosa 9 protein isoform X4 [Bos taurus]|uniref:retinitis pigmentosa 9 protein isoform X4 n=1 Tax=Bos taurus TaxID=9913 RepID=UPI0028CBB677|nr:retinitis pigmentosa 9 protein isoform X4 [Bos taurus]